MRWVTLPPSDVETVGDVIEEGKALVRDLCKDIAATDVDDRAPLLALLDQAGDLLESLIKGQGN